MVMNKKILYVDMDGVLCDFYGPFMRAKTDKTPYPHAEYGFFLNLEPLPGAIEAMKYLTMYYHVYILTRPSVRNILCYTEKAQWIKNHLGFEMLDKLIFACDKSMVKGDFLIDDQTDNGQTKFEGEHLHFGNGKFSDWRAVLKYLSCIP